MLRFARARYSRARFGPLDLFEDIWYWHNGTSGSKMALESDSGPAATLLAAGVSAGGRLTKGYIEV